MLQWDVQDLKRAAKWEIWATHHKMEGVWRQLRVTHVEVGSLRDAKERPIVEEGQKIIPKKAAKSR